METDNQKDRISNDQFGDAENTKNSLSNETVNEAESNAKTENPNELPTQSDKVEHDAEKSDSTPVEESNEEKVTTKQEETAAKVEENQPAQEVKPEEETTDSQNQELDQGKKPDKEDDVAEDAGEKEPDKPVNYTALSREELADKLKKLLESKPVQHIRADVESIKLNFYKKHKANLEAKRKEWINAGGDLEEFEIPQDPIEPQIKELLKQYRSKKAAYNREFEVQKQQNLELKQEIIEEIKELVNRNESVNQTFQDFRQLQQRWREVGQVPQANLNDLWDTYHHHVQNFYDYVKINKELRDLDLKRNLEEKTVLCEKAEELLLEPSIIVAFRKLQKYHNQWREVGPVPNENRTEIWERFKKVTSTINKKHQAYFEGLREEQKANLEAKKALCESAEEISSRVITTAKGWNKSSKEMIELQKVWKTIGFAPKKDNNKIYERFRTACDVFFNNKREFYKEVRAEQQENLQFKTDLCIQAEAIQDSSEWKKTTEELINLQKRWKEVGPVPRKYSDGVWKRFRAACDHFFKRKSEHFTTVDSKYEDNLVAKEKLIAEIIEFKGSENVEETLKVLKDFQRRWAEIGFVPLKKKDEIQNSYREAINKHFEDLKIDNSKKKILKFKTKIDTIQGNPRKENKLRFERDKLFNQMKQLENDIVLWENNIGFFAKSKNAEQLIKDVELKIEKARTKLKVLEEKILLIDNMDQA
ncbi:MAG: DUF349 domain-containing protein [Tenuifilaceae bacterium]|nr:DUF349 domain-containing protein [Tenuifilaceae bacterium]